MNRSAIDVAPVWHLMTMGW